MAVVVFIDVALFNNRLVIIVERMAFDGSSVKNRLIVIVAVVVVIIVVVPMDVACFDDTVVVTDKSTVVIIVTVSRIFILSFSKPVKNFAQNARGCASAKAGLRVSLSLSGVRVCCK